MGYEEIHTAKERAVVMYADGYVVCVYSDDGNVPHFHLLEGDKRNPVNENYICIDKAEYFDHSRQQAKLGQQTLEKLCGFLQRQVDRLSVTNWCLLLVTWNLNNSDNQIDTDIKMPDYKQLK